MSSAIPLVALSVLAIVAPSVRAGVHDMALPAQCKTCVHPKHSWTTLPVSFHSARDASNALGEFTESDLVIIAKFPLVTIEKWQGSLAMDASNRSVFLWEEDAMVNAARAIKKASPQTR